MNGHIIYTRLTTFVYIRIFSPDFYSDFNINKLLNVNVIDLLSTPLKVKVVIVFNAIVKSHIFNAKKDFVRVLAIFSICFCESITLINHI